MTSLPLAGKMCWPLDLRVVGRPYTRVSRDAAPPLVEATERAFRSYRSGRVRVRSGACAMTFELVWLAFLAPSTAAAISFMYHAVHGYEGDGGGCGCGSSGGGGDDEYQRAIQYAFTAG